MDTNSTLTLAGPLVYALAAVGPGIGIGLIFAAYVSGVARQPEANSILRPSRSSASPWSRSSPSSVSVFASSSDRRPPRDVHTMSYSVIASSGVVASEEGIDALVPADA